MEKQITETLMLSVDLDKLKDRKKGFTIVCKDEERWVLTHLNISEMSKLYDAIFEIANILNE